MRNKGFFVLFAALVGLAAPGHAATTVAYTYDNLGRLASATYTTGTVVKKITYQYDPAGNRTSEVTSLS